MKKILPFLFVSFSIHAFSQLDFIDLMLVSETNHVLRQHLTFSTSQNAQAFVEWERISGYGAGETMKTNVGPNTSEHHFIMIGFVGGSDYRYRVSAWNASEWNTTPWQYFTAPDLPAAIPYADSVNVINQNLTGYFLTSAIGIADPSIQLYNRAGEVVWYDYHGGEPVNGQMSQCRMFNVTDDQHLLTLECHELIERDLFGNILVHVDFSGTPYEEIFFHHDVIKNTAGNYVALGAELRTIDFTAIGGSATQGVIGEHLLEFDASGNVLMDWVSFDHFDPLTAVNTNAFWNPVFGTGNYNWWHSNSLHQDFDGNYLLSCKEIDQVMKINSTTGEVIWQVGGPGATIPFDDGITHTADQHDFNDAIAGKYIVMDNTGLGTQSRIMEFEIVEYDEVLAFKTWELIFPTSWFSNIMGTARRMPGGGANPNRYFACGNKGILGEVNHDGDLQWYLHQTAWVYRTYFFPELFENQTINIAVSGDLTVCLEDAPIDLNSLLTAPGEVHFYGEDVDNGMFDPATAGAGSHDIHYRYGDAGGEFVITIGLTSVTLESATICNGESILLGGMDQTESGTYVDLGVDGNGCTSYTFTTLTVTAGVDPSIIVTELNDGCASTWESSLQDDSYIYEWEMNGDVYPFYGPVINPNYALETENVTGRLRYATEGCESDWSPVVTSSCPVGVNEAVEESFSLSPNPTSGIVRIDGTQNLERAIVLDALGKRVLEKTFGATERTLDLSLLPNGIYTLRLDGREGLIGMKQVVKE